MLKSLLSKLLRDTADRLDSGSCELSDEEMLQGLEALSQYDNNQWLNKDQACKHLNISRSTFDQAIRCGLIPKGKKIRGWKEKIWIKSQLTTYDNFSKQS